MSNSHHFNKLQKPHAVICHSQNNRHLNQMHLTTWPLVNKSLYPNMYVSIYGYFAILVPLGMFVR